MCAVPKIWIFILLAILFYHQESNAQFNKTKGFDITAGLTLIPKVGMNLFFGDLVDSSSESYSFGVTADREMTEFLTIRTSFMGGQMRGKQIFPSLGTPYATFENFYVDFLVGGTYRPLNHFLGYFKERTVQPYALLQGGLIYYNSTETWGPASKSTLGSQPGKKWRSESGVAPVISAGGGLNLWINPSLTANIEFHGNLAFSDKLDAHDTWYDSWDPKEGVHTTEPYDFYYVVSAGVTFTIKDSKFKNDPKFNINSYRKSRKLYKPSSKKVTRKRPSRHKKKKFLFF